MLPQDPAHSEHVALCMAQIIPTPVATLLLTLGFIALFMLRSSRRSREEMMRRLYGPNGKPAGHRFRYPWDWDRR